MAGIYHHFEPLRYYMPTKKQSLFIGLELPCTEQSLQKFLLKHTFNMGIDTPSITIGIVLCNLILHPHCIHSVSVK